MASTSLLAVVLIVFHGWQPLLNDSPDIVIVRCLETPRGLTRMPDGTLGEISDGIYEVKVETEYSLVGRTNLGPAEVDCRARLKKGQRYLIFGKYTASVYVADNPGSVYLALMKITQVAIARLTC